MEEELDEGGSGKGKGAEKSLHKRRFHELEDLPSEHSDDPEYIPSAEATESEQEQEQGGGQGSDGDDEPLLNVDAGS
eukprot:g23778.t1